MPPVDEVFQQLIHPLEQLALPAEMKEAILLPRDPRWPNMCYFMKLPAEIEVYKCNLLQTEKKPWPGYWIIQGYAKNRSSNSFNWKPVKRSCDGCRRIVYR